MKKIARLANKRIDIYGYSCKDGIFFASYCATNDCMVKMERGINATINGKGVITCRKMNLADYKKEYVKNNDGKISKTSKFIKIISIIMIFLSVLTICLFTTSYNALLRTALFIGCFSVAIFIMSTQVSILILRILGDEKIKSLAKFHSAEHAVINAYKCLGRAPKIYEVDEYSSYSYNCGSLLNFRKSILFLLLSIVVLCASSFLQFLIGIIFAILITILLEATKAYYFLEFMILSKPTDKEYNVAVEGLSACIKYSSDMTYYLNQFFNDETN